MSVLCVCVASSSPSTHLRPLTQNVSLVRSLGVPFRPPFFLGLPGAPSGSLVATFSGTVKQQFSHPSFSSSLNWLKVLCLRCSPANVGKYGLSLEMGEIGLMGGVSKGEDSLWSPALSGDEASTRTGHWYEKDVGSSEGGVTH
jgi:hypothetical protein